MRISISAQSCDSVPPAPGWIVRIASRPSSGPCSIACSSMARTPSSSRATSLSSSDPACRRPAPPAAGRPARAPRLARVFRSSKGVTQFLRIFTSCTTVRARSWLVQNPGSPCCDFERAQALPLVVQVKENLGVRGGDSRRSARRSFSSDMRFPVRGLAANLSSVRGEGVRGTNGVSAKGGPPLPGEPPDRSPRHRSRC